MVRQEEAVSDDMYKEAAWRLRQQRLKKTDPADYARRIREVLLYADPMHWSSRSERYALIAERLEEIAREAGLDRGGVQWVRCCVLDGVWKAFDRGRDRVPVLEGVSLSVAAGEIVAVVGTRDQGKTTLLRVASGSLPADRGSVRLCDLELTGLSDGQLARVLRTEIGWAARTGPEVRVRVRDYVELPLATGRWLGWRERRLRVAKALKQLDVAGAAELRWGELSDWQRVLVELAQAVVGRPRVLLVDDVIDGLGLGKKQAAMEILRGFANDLGCGVLMAVSDHAAALPADRVWQLNGGRLKLMADLTDPDLIPLHKGERRRPGMDDRVLRCSRRAISSSTTTPAGRPSAPSTACRCRSRPASSSRSTGRAARASRP